MKKLFVLFLIFGFSFTLSGQGSRSCLDFPGTAANEHLNFGTAINTEIALSSFTIELWVKPRSINGDPSIISNKDWDSGNNTGFVLALENGNEFTFNFRPEGGTRRDVNLAVSDGLFNQWQHIAVTVNRSGVISLYRNGILGNTSASIATDAALSIAGNLSLRMGQDGVGDYGSKFDGQTDEFRIWNYARSEDEIRESMCLAMNGAVPGLLHRYAMDETDGNVINDAIGVINGNYLNASSAIHSVSGAPLGNQSEFAYTNNWDNTSVQLSSLESGTLLLDSILGNPSGLHIYRIDETPDNLSGTSGLAGNSVYFGIFACNGTVQNSQLVYDYSNFTNPSITAPDQLLLFGRENNASSNWDILNAFNSTLLENYSTNFAGIQQEFILGNIQADPCSMPSSITLNELGYSSVSLAWVSGGSFYWNLSYGQPGIVPEQGTILQAINQNPFMLDGLSPATTYQIYVQDTCLGNAASAWSEPFTFTTLPFPGNSASGTSLLINGTNQHVSCGTNSSLRPESEITYEAWIKPQEFQENWVGIFTNLQDNTTNESGYGLVYYNGEVRAFMMTTSMGGNAWNDAPGVAVPLQKWSHVACSYDGSFIRIYLNGMLKDSMAASGAIDWQYLPLDFRIGMFYDNNEAIPYRGEVDEIRIWNYARGVEQIRTTMCRKLQGSEPGLLAYFPMNEAVGNTINDLSAQSNTGTLTNMSESAWKISGAGIGDTSVFIYPESWGSVNFSLNATNFGSLQIALVSDNTEGIQVYRVDQAPFFTNGLNSVLETSGYFGVVIAGQNGPSDYLLSYNYGGFPEALADENNLVLFNRNNASENQWNIYPTEQDLNTNQLFRDNVSNGREYYLGTQAGNLCNAPSSVVFTTLSDSTVEVDWQAEFSTGINAEFGETGFSIGSGVPISVVQAPALLQPILPNTMYDFYIQNNCAGNEQSVWIGPFNFYSVFCTAPINPGVLSSDANSVTLGWGGTANAWRIQWGPVGFTLGTGIQIGNITENTRIISGLSQSTTYEFYIRSECGFGNSEYIGPFQFSTTSNVGFHSLNDSTVLLFPNPTKEHVSFINPSKKYTAYQLLSLNGHLLKSGYIKNENQTISLNGVAPGVYQIVFSNSQETLSKRLIVLP